MKKLITLAAILFSFQTFASDSSFNDTCRTIYGDATEQLLSSIELFQDGVITDVGLSLEAASISTELVAIRSSCSLMEDPINLEAVTSYKKLYREVRNKVKTLSLIMGTQVAVDMSIINLTVVKTKLKFLDYKFDRR